MTRKMGWSKNVLIHQIENQSYEKTLLNQTNFDQAVTPEIRNQAKLAVRDEYTFDFLELGAEHSEREMERALIARIEDFLRAMGGLFAFVGSQFRLEVDGREYFIDLLLFHRRLKCLVALELKIGEFEPEFVGKMQFYLAARARAIVMQVECGLGFEPTDREFEKLGYDVENSVPGTGKLRFIEVKGRVSGAPTITVTRNEILYSLNKPEDFILAIVEFLDGDSHRVHYMRQPFQREPDFGVTSVNYNFAELLSRAKAPL